MLFQDLLKIINTQEVIMVQDTEGHILLDSKDLPLYEVIDTEPFDNYFYSDNWQREVIDITVVKQDLSLDETTLLITLL